MTPKLRAFLLMLAVALSVDQASKAWIDTRLDPGERREVIAGFLSVTHARNPGAAFGLMRDWPSEWRMRVFVASALLAALVIGSFLNRLAPGDRWAAGALGLVLGGAIGNFTDRLLRGEVIDLLHVQLWDGYPWPEFNFADAFIVLGVAALIVELVAVEGASRSDGEPA